MGGYCCSGNKNAASIPRLIKVYIFIFSSRATYAAIDTSESMTWPPSLSSKSNYIEISPISMNALSSARLLQKQASINKRVRFSPVHFRRAQPDPQSHSPHPTPNGCCLAVFQSRRAQQLVLRFNEPHTRLQRKRCSTGQCSPVKDPSYGYAPVRRFCSCVSDVLILL